MVDRLIAAVELEISTQRKRDRAVRSILNDEAQDPCSVWWWIGRLAVMPAMVAAITP